MNSKSQERFQLLHHVATRNVSKGLNIVGNKDKIMFGVFVNYKQETIDAYKVILNNVYERALKDLYECTPMSILSAKIEAVLKSREMKPIGLTFHAFLTDLYL